MLQIDELDQGRPIQAHATDGEFDSESTSNPEGRLAQALPAAPPDLAREIWNARNGEVEAASYITPIETPLTFSGAHPGALDVFRGYFRRAGLVVMQGGTAGGAAAASVSGDPSLSPGQPRGRRARFRRPVGQRSWDRYL